MFAKLLKYEFKWVSKPLTMISIAALAAGGLGGLLFRLIYDETLLEQTDTLIAVYIILLGGIFIALAAYGIGAEILLLYRFYKHKFSDEGYLTFTTPASTHQILLSSILNILIWSIICMVILSIALTLIFWPLLADQQNLIHFLDINNLLNYLDIRAEDVILTVFSMICTAVYSLILPLLSITVGSLLAKKHKLLCAFVIGYGISMAVSTLTGILNVTVYLEELTNVIESTSQALQASMLIPSIIQLVIGIGGYFLMHYLIDKKLNI